MTLTRQGLASRNLGCLTPAELRAVREAQPRGDERPGLSLRRPQRWLARREGDVVFRVVRGESMDMLREFGLGMHGLPE